MPNSPTSSVILRRLALAHNIGTGSGLSPTRRIVRTVDGVALNCLDWSGSDDPILLLHGGALTCHTWDLFSLAMGNRFRCIAPDLRGHGESSWAESYKIDDYVSDIAAIVASFGWTRVHLVGMSLGGIVAAHYAATVRSGVSSLVLIDVAPDVDFEAIGPMRQTLSRSIAHLTLDELVDSAVAGGARGGRDTILYRFLHMTRASPDAGLGWIHDRKRSRDHDHYLGKLQQLAELAETILCPVLVVRGGSSGVLTDEKVAAFARRCRRGNWLTIPNAGHNVQEDQPAALAAALTGFLVIYS